MKKASTFIYMTVIVLMISCEKELDINFGFNSAINRNSKGLVIADISDNVEKIYLNGYVRLKEGEVELKLLNPNGVAIFSKTLVAPIEFEINETFDATNGYWKLRYKSNEGIGKIDLHLH